MILVGPLRQSDLLEGVGVGEALRRREDEDWVRLHGSANRLINFPVR